jgi:hypothetical protein
LEPVAPRLARNTVIESTFEVGWRYRSTTRVDCGRLDPGVVIRPELGEWHQRMPDRLDEEELADWRAGHDAIYQLAALTVEISELRSRAGRYFRAGLRERLEPCCGGGPRRGCRRTSRRSPR